MLDHAAIAAAIRAHDRMGVWTERLLLVPDRSLAARLVLVRDPEAAEAQIGADMPAVDGAGHERTSAFSEYLSNLKMPLAFALRDRLGREYSQARDAMQAATRETIAFAWDELLLRDEVEAVAGDISWFADEFENQVDFMILEEFTRRAGCPVDPGATTIAAQLRDGYRAGGLPVGLTRGAVDGQLIVYWPHAGEA